MMASTPNIKYLHGVLYIYFEKIDGQVSIFFTRADDFGKCRSRAVQGLGDGRST